MDHLSPGTWHAYARALSRREASGGEWPPAAELLAAEGADPWALMVLTRGELPRRPTGELERVFAREEHYTRPSVEVPTREALWAVLLREDWLYARLFTPWGYEIDPRLRRQVAEEWPP